MVYFVEESALLEVLRSGAVDAVARGKIGNADAVAESVGAFANGARGSHRQLGGFALTASDHALAT